VDLRGLDQFEEVSDRLAPKVEAAPFLARDALTLTDGLGFRGRHADLIARPHLERRRTLENVLQLAFGTATLEKSLRGHSPVRREASIAAKQDAQRLLLVWHRITQQGAD